MNDPSTWTEADLLQLIKDEVEESLQLDYKAAAALDKTDGKKVEIGKDVSSFANSVGGTIVYGMQEDKLRPTSLDGIDQSSFSKEWLEQVISAQIQRKIDGIVINPIKLLNGKYVYVVCIPQSMNAPHQAKDKRFYKRYNFESVAMEEYEVRDIMNRKHSSNVAFVWSNPHRQNQQEFRLNPELINLGRGIAGATIVRLYIESNFQFSVSRFEYAKELHFVQNQNRTFMVFDAKFLPTMNPLLYNYNTKIFDYGIDLRIPSERLTTEEQVFGVIGYKLFTEGSEVTGDFFQVTGSESTLRISNLPND